MLTNSANARSSLFRRMPVAQIGRQQFFVIGVRRSKRGELARSFVDVALVAEAANQRDPIRDRQRRAVLDARFRRGS